MRLFILVAGAILTLTSRLPREDRAPPGGEPRVLRGSNAIVSAIAFSSDGIWLAAASHDRAVRVWDARTYRLVKTLAGHRGEVYDVAFSPDGTRMASVSYEGQLIVWSWPAGRIVRSIALPTWATSVAFSPDGARLAVPLQNNELRIYDVRTAALDTVFTVNTNAVASRRMGVTSHGEESA